MSATPPRAEDEPVLLQELIQLTEAQLADSWAITRDQNTYALGLSGLAIAILGVVVAAQPVLGGDWWVPVPGLAATAAIALVATRGASNRLGPEPALFYEAVKDRTTQEALAQLLADLVQAQRDVPTVLQSQRRGLLWVAALFAATLVYSVVLLV